MQYRYHAKYVAAPNNSQYEISRDMCELLKLTLTLQLTLKP